MNQLEIIKMMGALASIVMIMLGSRWLKQAIVHLLCSCRVNYKS